MKKLCDLSKDELLSILIYVNRQLKITIDFPCYCIKCEEAPKNNNVMGYICDECKEI